MSCKHGLSLDILLCRKFLLLVFSKFSPQIRASIPISGNVIQMLLSQVIIRKIKLYDGKYEILTNQNKR
jgi:hypothetical protein